MKFIWMVFAALLVFGCKKDNPADGIYNKLAGTWELSRFAGGWSAEQTYAPGNGNTIFFTSDGNFTKTSRVITDTSDATQTVTTLSGTYTIAVASSCSGNTTEYIITFNNDDRRQVVTIKGTELTLEDGPCIADGSSATYIKK